MYIRVKAVYIGLRPIHNVMVSVRFFFLPKASFKERIFIAWPSISPRPSSAIVTREQVLKSYGVQNDVFTSTTRVSLL